MDFQKPNIETLIFLGVGTLFFTWSWYNKSPQNTDQSESQCIKEMKQMRDIVTRGHMTLEECRKSLWLVFSFSMEKVNEHNSQMKKKRNSINNMEKYLETLILGVQEGKATVAKAKVQAYQRMGITNNTFQEFQAEIASLKKQFKKEYLQKNKQKELSFVEIQHLLGLQIEFFQNEGEDLAREIIKATLCWPKDKKLYIKLVVPLIIIDKALKDFPHIDETQFESAKRKYREQLGDELYKLSEVSQNFTKIIRQYLYL